MFEENNYSRIPVIDDPFLKEKNELYKLEVTLEQITDLLFILDCYRRETLSQYKNSSVENQRRCFREYDILLSKSENLINFFEGRLVNSHRSILLSQQENDERIKSNLSWRYRDKFVENMIKEYRDLGLNEVEKEN